MNKILNYIKVNESISTAGQPTIEQFALIKEEGFKVVINLALSNSSNALENEDKIVSEHGLVYIHLPVDFENPKRDDLILFLKLLQNLENKKVLVHCAKNYRVTAFMYVYHKYILNSPLQNVDLSIFDEWTPSQKWQELMKIEL